MQKLLWIGSPFFAHELPSLGWSEVHIHNFEDSRVYSWQELINIAGFTPDVLVVADKSRPPFVLGMEDFPCLTVFYSVDSHIHSWQPLYAQGFDVALVSLYDHVEHFVGPNLENERVLWSPPFAREGDQPDPAAEKIWDCLFVGNLNNETMPERTNFLAELACNVPGLEVRSGNYRELFPKARTLVNHAARGDLNFRVFEAMACGGCLVTPRVGNGLERLFVDGEHMVGYSPDDAGDAAYRINFLLRHPDLADYIGKTANQEINARHRAHHRAEAFTDKLCDLMMNDPAGLISRRLGRASAIRKDFLSIPYLLWGKEIESPLLKEAYLAAARGKFSLRGVNE